jgi:hypothetical protein
MRLIRTPPPSLLLAASRGPHKDSRIIGYEAAAWLYGFDGFPKLKPAFLIPHGSWRRGPHDHQRRHIDDIEFVEMDGLLVTSVRQTIGDLCVDHDLDRVERAVEYAIRTGLVTEDELREFAAQLAYWRHGTPNMCEVLARRAHGAPPTGSDLETRYLQVIRRGGIADPLRQVEMFSADGASLGFADFGWHGLRFLVEMDGFESHGTPDALNYDLTRQNAILRAGYDLRRFTHRHVERTPKYVIRETTSGLAVAMLSANYVSTS